MSLLPDTSGGYYDDTGHWQSLKFCFASCGSRCTCAPPGGMYYNPLFDKSKTDPPPPGERGCVVCGKADCRGHRP